MRRLVTTVAVVAAAAAIAAGFATSAWAYGGGATHNTWQIAISSNCDNPSLSLDPTGAPSEGGFWGWVEFDQWSNGSIAGDAELTFCGHTTGGGGAGAGHESIDISAAHLDPLTGDFVIDVASDPGFEGDTGVAFTPGHDTAHPAPGISQVMQVSYRAAR